MGLQNMLKLYYFYKGEWVEWTRLYTCSKETIGIILRDSCEGYICQKFIITTESDLNLDIDITLIQKFVKEEI